MHDRPSPADPPHHVRTPADAHEDHATGHPVDGLDAFKRVFRRHAAGVAAITSLAPNGEPVGFTATSLASLAAVPPLATFNIARIATAWPAMTVGNRVVIHTLGPRTKVLAERMAGDHAARFDGDHWHPGPYGLPILDGVTAWMLGPIVAVHPVENNAIVVVNIQDGAFGPEDEALLYHERTYQRPCPLDDQAQVGRSAP